MYLGAFTVPKNSQIVPSYAKTEISFRITLVDQCSRVVALMSTRVSILLTN